MILRLGGRDPCQEAGVRTVLAPATQPFALAASLSGVVQSIGRAISTSTQVF